MRYKNVIMINSKEELEAFKQGVAKTLQTDFGVRWDYGTADADDERALAMALACLMEFNVQFASKDQNINQYLFDLQTRSASKEFFREES
ncbi:hypothetical protein J8137_09840 [Lactiplantibacillus plantarum]|nr:hypothetical protein [Lactiplantibacillus plantarum]